MGREKMGVVTSKLKTALLYSVGVAACALSTSSFAFQETPAAPGEAVELGIREIVVTAQKRSERIQDVPLAITALDSVALDQAGIKDAQGLSGLIPNVVVRPFNNTLVVATRGISNENTTNLGDASLAFHANGVYIGRPRGQTALFYDVERVELLRGPQGTLYGRNSTAGALNIITKRPEIGTFGAGADISYGNYDAVVARGYINIPLADNLAVRINGLYSKHDGYAINNRLINYGPTPSPAQIANNQGIGAIKNGDDDNERAARISLKYEPSDALSIVIVGEYQKANEVGQTRSVRSTPGYVLTTGAVQRAGATPATPIIRTFAAGDLFLPQAQDPTNPRVFSLNDQPVNKDKNWGVSSEINWSLSNSVLLTMVSGYRENDNFVVSDAGGAANNSRVIGQADVKQVSNELRLTSQGASSLKWLFGLYYYDEDISDRTDVNNLGGGPQSLITGNSQISSQALAAFGQINYALTDKLNLQVGARYSRDHKTRTNFTVTYPATTPVNAIPPFTFFTNDQSWNSFDWKIGVDYKVAENSMLYANVSTGYRAGGFNNNNSVSYDPEEITSYEIGLKNDFLDRTLRLNVNGFYYDYQNLQVTAPREVNGVVGIFTQNAASAKIWGLELEGVAQPVDWLSVDFNFGYLNTKFGDFRSADSICGLNGFFIFSTVSPAIDPRPGCTLELNPRFGQPGQAQYLQVANNNRGNRLSNAPDITLSFGTTVTLFNNARGKLTARGSIRVVGESFLSEFNRSIDRVSSYTNSDARLTYATSNDRFSLEAFVQNIEDKAIPASISLTISGAATANNPPRTYGVRAGFKF
jgi:iron complex outermembrane recepter protein